MKTRPAPFAALLLALTASTASGAVTDDYAWAWPIATQGSDAAWQVELTPQVYAASTRDDLRDIAIVNAAGEAVPMALGSTPATAAEHLVALPLFALPAASAQTPNAGDDAIRMKIERREDGQLHSVDVDLGNGSGRLAARAPDRDLLLDASTLHQPLTGLRIGWNGAAASQTARFSVAASDDLQQWRVLADNITVLHLVQDGGTLERHDVAIDTPSKYLRLRRLDDGAALDQLVVEARTRTATDRRAALQWLAADVEGSDTQRTVVSGTSVSGQDILAWRYRLPAALPVERARITLADDNALARVTLLSAPTQASTATPPGWTPRSDIVAFALHQDGSTISNDDLDLPAAPRARDWRVEAANPLPRAPTLRLAYRPDRFVFLAQGAGPYRLVAGSGRARRPDYPVDGALGALRAKLGADWLPPLAALGERATLAGDAALAAPAAPSAASDWRTWLLWVVLVGAAALIAGMALSLLRKQDA